MKIFIVHMGDVLLCPPVLNLLNILEKNKIKVKLISTKSELMESNRYENIVFHELPICYEKSRKITKKLFDMFSLRKEIWKEIDDSYTKKDLIWITSDTALKHLGNRILKYNYVLQLMELSEEIRYYSKLPLKMDATTIGNNALAVVVPEFNRAHIIKAWWKLKEKPLILANKPHLSVTFKKEEYIEDETARNIIDSLKSKKIILYQGIIHKERPLDKYIYAIDKLGDEYAFVVMSAGENIYKNIKSRNYYFIPGVRAPYHLQITSHAYIGVLSYFPCETGYSILNALYCAPNKTYEYAMFDIPMLGNDVPGLKYVIDTYGCGTTIEDFETDAICNAIKQIENSYDEMSKGAHHYYEDTDLEKQLLNILEVVSKKIMSEI